MARLGPESALQSPALLKDEQSILPSCLIALISCGNRLRANSNFAAVIRNIRSIATPCDRLDRVVYPEKRQNKATIPRTHRVLGDNFLPVGIESSKPSARRNIGGP